MIDLNADQYNTVKRNYRYNITSTVTVTSRNVKLVRSIIARQGELLKQGVAVVDGGDSKLGKILDAGQGQFTITDRDGNTPYIKKLRVVSTVTYSLKD